MNCFIPGQNLKVFAKALHSLAKVGDDLYITAYEEKLKLVTTNLRKTVCVQYDLSDCFFSNYEILNKEQDEANLTSCKIQMKTLLPLFKGSHLEKKMEYIKIEYVKNSDFIFFKMKYRNDDILMTHKLRLMESQSTISITCDPGCNNIVTSSAFCNQLLNMFSNSDEDILFEITREKAVVRNYCIDAPVKLRSVRSQVNLEGSKFLKYNINLETTVNFSLKPFRTAISFADAFNLNLIFSFEKGGKPISISMNNPTFEANYIVATIDPYDNQSTNTSIVTTKINQTTNNNNANITLEDQEALLSENWEIFDSEPDKLQIIENRVINDKSTKKNFAQLVQEARSNPSNEKNLQNTHLFQNNQQSDISKSPESPKTKKAKLVFGRCFESTFVKDQSFLGEMLAPNSDSE